MTTAKALVDEIIAMLHGYGSTADRVTPLSNSIGATDTTFTVTNTFGQSVGITPGVVEIDSEQLYVQSVDSGTGVCTLASGFGRGYGDTTAVAHSAGARVVSRPKFPRIWVFQQINETIGGLYPELYRVNTWTGTVTYPLFTYNITGATGTPMEVIQVQWQDPIGNWRNVRGYKVDPYDGTMQLGSGALVGRPLRVLYKTQPDTFTAETDDFAVTGLPASCFDVLALAVVAKQVPGLDISRAQVSSVEQSTRSTVVPPNAGITASSYLMKLFQDRLTNEAQTLRKQYKSRMVQTW